MSLRLEHGSPSHEPAAGEHAEPPGDQTGDHGTADVQTAEPESAFLEIPQRLVVERRVGGEPAPQAGREGHPERRVELLDREGHLHDRPDQERSEGVDDQGAPGERRAGEPEDPIPQKITGAGPDSAGDADPQKAHQTPPRDDRAKSGRSHWPLQEERRLKADSTAAGASYVSASEG